MRYRHIHALMRYIGESSQNTSTNMELSVRYLRRTVRQLQLFILLIEEISKSDSQLKKECEELVALAKSYSDLIPPLKRALKNCSALKENTMRMLSTELWARLIKAQSTQNREL